ncbi:hypothetical protein GCM10010429_50530 [Micromonospora olivasterospora]
MLELRAVGVLAHIELAIGARVQACRRVDAVTALPRGDRRAGLQPDAADRTRRPGDQGARPCPRKTPCCSFTSAVTAEPATDGESLTLDVQVPAQYTDVRTFLAGGRRARTGPRRRGRANA